MPTCFFCGADTPTQWRRPGLLSKLPKHLQGRFGYCHDHASDADAKIAAAIGVDTQDAPRRVPTGSRPGLAGQSGKGGPDRAKGEEGDDGNSSQGVLI